MTSITRRALLLLLALVGTFVLLRVSLQLSPNSNFDVGPYNIHHLFTGLVLLTFSVIPLLLHMGKPLVQDGLMLVFGAGLSMALDEWVYLIATDGSDAAYLLPVSFWGGVIVIGAASVYTLAMLLLKHRCAQPD